MFVSVVPSPYQRDVFRALADRKRVNLQVYYLEDAAPDSPWPQSALAPWEKVLPGFTLGRGRWRSHFNWPLPKPRGGETWVVNGAMTDMTTQWYIRRFKPQFPWYFWGEQPSVATSASKRWIQARQYSPLGSARAIVAVGERARDGYSQLVPNVAVLNQPYTCRLDQFVQTGSARTGNREPVFLFCGQMIARKGIDLLLQAFARLVAEGTPGRLELVGREADLPRYLASVDDATKRRITYRGFQAPADLPAAFGQADVFVLPSRHDGWGVVVNQALACGAAVICSDAVGAARDLIEPDVNGLLVPTGDISALAHAMRRLALAPELRKSLGARAVITAERLTPDRSAAFWEQLVSDDVAA